MSNTTEVFLWIRISLDILHDMFYLRTCWVIVIFKSKVHLMMLTGNNGGRRQRGMSWIRTILDLLTTEYKRRPARSFNLSRNTSSNLPTH